jgi:hypothetical protein
MRIFGPKGDKIKGEQRKLHREELKDLDSPNIIWAMKTRRKRWEGHVACVQEEERFKQGFGGEI